MTRHFTPQLFSFLRDLAEHNDRDWFAANQERFEHDVRQPALAFIEDFAEPLERISPHFSADPRKVGGSLFRIHRDTRFSKDKTPYKTHVGIQFRHVASHGDVHAPGFYLHLEPRACYAGLGLWRPATADARAIRSTIAAAPDDWAAAAHGRGFAAVFGLEGDQLVRVPTEFPADHRFAEDLRRKDFIAGTSLTQAHVTGDGFIDRYAEMCRTATPFMRFLCTAVGVGF